MSCDIWAIFLIVQAFLRQAPDASCVLDDLIHVFVRHKIDEKGSDEAE